MSDIEKHISVAKKKVKEKKIIIETGKKDKEGKKEYTLDVVEEQQELPATTIHSKDAEKDLKKVKKNPEQYLEINMVKKSRVVDTFYIKVDKATFQYKNKHYHINEDVVYLLPMKGYFVPTCYYKEGTVNPVGFKQKNKGITGKALTLLYKTRLYDTLLKVEDNSLNIFIVFFTILLMILYGIGMYFLFFHNGGQINGGGGEVQPIVTGGLIWLRKII